MSRTLAVISATSLILCVVFFGLARMIGGAEIFHDQKSLIGVKPLIDLATHKEWRWEGGDSLDVDAPVDMRYQAGGPPRVTVTGDADLLGHVRVSKGRIVSDEKQKNDKEKSGKKERLNAVISGVALKKISVGGLDRLDLGEIHQDELAITVSGVGSVTGKGTVGHLDLTVSGAGKADLGELDVGTAVVSVGGGARVSIAPRDDLKVQISGAGRVILASTPRQIQQTITGAGRLETEASEPAPPSKQPPPPPQPPPAR
ncbi:MAG TPA: DUF2807 domain-containing protein [Rhizomicrobium sp.]|nr:DUF2807 domain-containing protein [Rhizomicrobium sp.]